MSETDTASPDIDLLARRAKEMLERVQNATGVVQTATDSDPASALRTAVSGDAPKLETNEIATADEPPEAAETDLEPESSLDEAIDDLVEDTDETDETDDSDETDDQLDDTAEVVETTDVVEDAEVVDTDTDLDTNIDTSADIAEAQEPQTTSELDESSPVVALFDRTDRADSTEPPTVDSPTDDSPISDSSTTDDGTTDDDTTDSGITDDELATTNAALFDGTSHVLNTADQDDAGHRLSVLASRAKESLRAAQEETEAHPPKESAQRDAALASAAGWRPEQVGEAQNDAQATAEAELAAASAILDEPLSISREEISFPELIGTPEGKPQSQAKGAEVDPETAIFGRPSADPTPARSASENDPIDQFAPIDPSTTEEELSPLFSRKDDDPPNYVAIGSAAVFLLAIVGVFALLFAFRGDSDTDVAAGDESAELQTDDQGTPEEIDNTGPGDEAETEVLAETENPPSDSASDDADAGAPEDDPAVAEPEAVGAAPTAWEVLSNDENTAPFASLAGQAGLISLLDDADPSDGLFTVFAPSSAAVSELTADDLADLQGEDGRLEALVGYHLVEGQHSPESLAELANGQVIAQNGLPLLVSEVGGQTLINGVPLGEPVETSNGSVFLIDSILEPPTINQILELETIQFEVISATITPAGQTELGRALEFLEEMPELQVTIEGHTDTDGEADANLALSERRANAVRDFLIAGGIDADRLVAVGFGETDPVLVDGVEDKDASRRIEFVFG